MIFKGADDAPQAAEGPGRLPRKLARSILNKCAADNGWPKNLWAYDGNKSIYTPNDFLPKAKHVFAVTLPDQRRAKEFEVKSKYITFQYCCLYMCLDHSFPEYLVDWDIIGS